MLAARDFRNALGRFATGVVVVSARSGDACHAMTANAFMSGSLEPPLIVVSVARRARMHELLDAGGAFGVTVLTQAQETHSRYFAGQQKDACDVRFAELAGVPVLEEGCARLAARILQRHECGDHTLFVGEVQALDAPEEPEPLLFFAGRYAKLEAAGRAALQTPSPLPFVY